MITPTGTCRACDHPWAWHRRIDPDGWAALNLPGCTGRAAAGWGPSHPCDCRRVVPRDAYRVQPDPGITEAELRALWGDR